MTSEPTNFKGVGQECPTHTPDAGWRLPLGISISSSGISNSGPTDQSRRPGRSAMSV